MQEYVEKILIIRLPRTFGDVDAIEFLNALDRERFSNELVYHFSDIVFVFPFGTLLIAEKIRELSANRRAKLLSNRIGDANSIREADRGALGYLKFFGFFTYIGVPLGSDYNRPIRRSNYTPINTITIKALTYDLGKEHWTESIIARCEQIASIVSANKQVSIELAYCIREIVRNVFEHSESDRCTVMAQLYSSTNIVEISIVDCGIGIVNSLRAELGNGKSDAEILERALLPGISSKHDHEVIKGWKNSGFGLYILSELGKQYGEFAIVSGGIYLKYYDGNRKSLIDDVAYSGTAIKLRLSLRDVDYFPNQLEGIVRRGEDYTEELFGKRIKASSISRKSGSHV